MSSTNWRAAHTKPVATEEYSAWPKQVSKKPDPIEVGVFPYLIGRQVSSLGYV